MPSATRKPVSSLTLDLANFRTPPQKNEAAALKAMVATDADADAFWELMESLLDDDFLPTENIIVLETAGKLIVKEGNRRIAALKLLLGQLSSKGIVIPPKLEARIKAMDKKAKKDFEEVPCAVFTEAEAEIVDKIVHRTHGYDAKAGRLKWNPVGKARHDRDHSGGAQPSLDLLESYLNHGENLSAAEKVSWGAHYPLTLLDEALQKLAPRLGLDKWGDIPPLYPKKLTTAQVKGLEKLLHDIGMRQRSFEYFRETDFDPFATYGFPAPQSGATSSGSGSSAGGKGASGGGAASSGGGTGTGASGGASSADSKGSKGAAKTAKKTAKKPKTFPSTDPRSVTKRLREMVIVGKDRQKLEDLRIEAIELDIKKTPLAFCFVLRSMFEISAKAYYNDHRAAKLPTKDKNGYELKLAQTLSEVSKHLISSAPPADHTKIKQRLHGATAELGAPNRILSVTSMNQLVHSNDFSVAPRDICGVFHNVFALLELMNA